jgi:protein O-mannosyl-transferase
VISRDDDPGLLSPGPAPKQQLLVILMENRPTFPVLSQMNVQILAHPWVAIDHADPRPTRMRRSRIWVIGLALAISIGFAFSPVIDAGFFALDDAPNFTSNLHFRGLGWDQLKWAWRTSLMGVYQPLSWVILLLESAMFGLDPRGYHLCSILLHAANAVVLYLLTVDLLRLAMPEAMRRDGERLKLMTAVSTAFFALHPLRTEVVVWASCQPYLPSAFFFMSAIRCYLRAQGGEVRNRTGWLFASFFAGWAALLCKAPAVVLPAVLVILDAYPLRRLKWGCGPWPAPELTRALREKVPFLVLSLAFIIIAPKVRGNAETPLAFKSLSPRVALACYSAWFYPIKTIAPLGLYPCYPLPPIIRTTDPTFLSRIILTTALTVALIAVKRRFPGILATWACYLALLAPTSGLIHFGWAIAADRYSYFPALSWAPLGAAGLYTVCRRTYRPRGLAIVLGLALFAGLIGLTRAQCRLWRAPSEALWRHALAHSSSPNPLAHTLLGGGLAIQGRLEESIVHSAEAVRIDPTNFFAQSNLVQALITREKYAEAEEKLTAAVRLLPSPEFQTNLAYVLTKQQKYHEAVDLLSKIADIQPKNAIVHYNLGYALARLGRLEGAATSLSRARAIRPDWAEAHYELGSVLSRSGRIDEAISSFSEALRINPDYAEARQGLADVIQKTTRRN